MSDFRFTGSLYTYCGERKYLNADERKRFLAALPALENEADRLFCELIFWTGCRISEALATTPFNVDLDEGVLVIKSLKKRGALKGKAFRAVPVPRKVLDRLEACFQIRDQQRSDHDAPRLWRFSRTTAWRLMKLAMERAKICGVKSCARGLRHSVGVHAVLNNVPTYKLQCWLGHARLETVAIYCNAIGPEDRAIAQRMWRG